VGEALVEAKGVRMITLSGSTAEGRRVGVLAGKHLERVALELGGKTNFVSVEVSASRVPGVRVKQRWVLVHGALPRGVRVPVVGPHFTPFGNSSFSKPAIADR
jgi:hypothetical protein